MDLRQKRAERLAAMAVAAIVILNAFALSGEFIATRLQHNDSLLHFTLVQAMVQQIEHGGNPLDWFMESPFGFPFIRIYQPLAHLLVAGLYFALGKSVALLTIFTAVRYLAMALLPLSFYVAARWLDLPRWTAVAAAVLAPLVAAGGLYGIEYESYTWLGYGLFAQAVAVHLLVLAIGLSSRALRRGGSVVPAGILLGLTCCAHFIYGYIGAVTVCLMALLPNRSVPIRTRLFRTVSIGGVALLISAFQLIALAHDARLLCPTGPNEQWKVDSYGALAVLQMLVSGQFLDHGRFPVLSLLALAGIAAIAWRYFRTRRIAAYELVALAGLLLWILILFGRPTWGPALWLLGVTPDVPLHRVVAAVQLFLVLLAAIGLTEIAGRIRRPVLAVAACAVLLLPAAWERVDYLRSSRDARLRYISAIAAEKPNLDSVTAAVRQRGGYAYAGKPAWQAFQIGGWEFYLYLISQDVQQMSYEEYTIDLPWFMTSVFDDVQPAQYRLFNVRTAILPPLKAQPPAFLVPRLSAGRFHVYDAPGAGYFDVVDAVASVSCDRHSYFDIDTRWMASPLLAQRAHLLLDFFRNAPAALPRIAPLDSLPPNPYSAPPGDVTAEHRSADTFAADLTAARPAFALFRMSYHPNWKATLDGSSAPTYMLSPGFLGVPVGAGTHHLQLRYHPDSARIPLAFGGLTLAVLFAAAEVFTARRAAKRTAQSS